MNVNGTEDFINWLNDLHWGPLEFLRPPKNVNIGLGRFAVICAVGVPLTMIGVLVSLPLVDFYFAHPDFHRLPTLAQYEAVARHLNQVEWFLAIAGGAAFPFGFWPFAHYWNRRAARLRQPPPPALPEQEGVWPPAPKRA